MPNAKRSAFRLSNPSIIAQYVLGRAGKAWKERLIKTSFEEEVRALERDFGGVEFVKSLRGLIPRKFVGRRLCQKKGRLGYLIVRVPEFDVEKVVLGPYIIFISITKNGMGSIRVAGTQAKIWKLVYNKYFPHPNVDYTLKPCVGIGEKVFDAAKRGGRVSDMFLIVSSVLHSNRYVYGFAHLDRWKHNYMTCIECGISFRANAASSRLCRECR